MRLPPFAKAALLCHAPLDVMCDTLAIKSGGAIWFAKNSDREPAEEQRVEIHPAVAGDSASRLSCTYIEIDQVAERRAVILSRPQWMWGAEMGVNDAGVAIGNQAVFSRSVMKSGAALLGMDLLRLGLERSESGEEAVDVITSLLERYGQGGPAGFSDRKFRYDSSFLIADSKDIFVLETAGREWAVKRISDSWSISNGYSLRDDYDSAFSSAAGDFKARHESFAMPRLACAAARRAATSAGVGAAPEPMSLLALARLLRHHAKGDGFEGGSNNDLCMHASGVLRPHATTASMIAVLRPGARPLAAFTGAVHPCLSLFRPVAFSGAHWSLLSPRLYADGLAVGARALRDRTFRESARRSIGNFEPAILSAIERGDVEAAEGLARRWDTGRLSPGVSDDCVAFQRPELAAAHRVAERDRLETADPPSSTASDARNAG